MNNLFQGRRLKYLLYFGALVTVGSTGFHCGIQNTRKLLLIVGIANGEAKLYLILVGYILSIEDKLMLIGSHENLNDFKENINN